MVSVPISNEAIADVVWAALELSDRCKGGTDIEIDILPSGAVVLNIFLQGYNKSPEYRQYRIHSDEDAEAALEMLEEAKTLRKPREVEPKKRICLKEWIIDKAMRLLARIDHIRDAVREEREGWIMLKRAERSAQQ